MLATFPLSLVEISDDKSNEVNKDNHIKTSEWVPGFNYTIIDNYPYSWIEINETGTLLAYVSNEDDDAESINITAEDGWEFTFYGTSYTNITVDTNGWMTFQNANDGWTYNFDGQGSYDWRDIPQNCSDWSDSYDNNRNHNDTVCLLATDLIPSDYGQIFYEFFGNAPNRYLVIEYFEVAEINAESYLTMEAIFYENGDIKFQYKNITDPMSGMGWDYPDAKVGLVHGDLINYSNYTNDWNAAFGGAVNELAVYFRLNRNYTMDTNADYNWYELRRDGTHMTWLSNEDDEYDIINFTGQGWNFTFYDTEYTNISVSSNGWMSFPNLGDTRNWIVDIPNNILENQDCVSLLSADLDLETGGDVYYYFGGSSPNRYLIIEYYRAYDFDNEMLVGDFEVFFHESGNIKFQYKLVTDIAYADFPIIGLDHGDLTYYNNYAPTLPLTEKAIKFIIDASAEDLVDFTATIPPPAAAPSGDDDDDDDGEEAIPGFDLYLILLSSILALIAVVKKLRKNNK